MHKLTSAPITLDCFEIDDFDPDLVIDKVDQSELTEVGKEYGFIAHWHIDSFWKLLIIKLEDLRQMVLKTENPELKKAYWKELVRLLPEAWLQKRTVTLNYENIFSMIHQRKNHKLREWREDFINWTHTLPHAEQLLYIGVNDTNEDITPSAT